MPSEKHKVKCVICREGLAEEAEMLHDAGFSTEKIAELLQGKYKGKEKITRETVRRHINAAKNDEAVERVDKSAIDEKVSNYDPFTAIRHERIENQKTAEYLRQYLVSLVMTNNVKPQTVSALARVLQSAAISTLEAAKTEAKLNIRDQADWLKDLMNLFEEVDDKAAEGKKK